MATVPSGLLERLESAPYGAYAIDLEQTIIFWNAQAERILGYRSESVLGRKCYEVVQGIQADGLTPICRRDCPTVAAARRGQLPPATYVRAQCASGQVKRLTIIPLVATDDDDRPILVQMFHEIPADLPPASAISDHPLTARELEVLRMVASGLRPAEIAQQLVISIHTVRKHISNACEKLHSHGMMSAVLTAQRQNLL